MSDDKYSYEKGWTSVGRWMVFGESLERLEVGIVLLSRITPGEARLRPELICQKDLWQGLYLILSQFAVYVLACAKMDLVNKE